MPAVTYLDDHQVKAWSRIVGDHECNGLLQELRDKTGRDWLIQVIERSPKLSMSDWWQRRALKLQPKYYTLYLGCHGEWQIINLMTPRGGSVFSIASREDVMNYMMGVLNGLSFGAELALTAVVS